MIHIFVNAVAASAGGGLTYVRNFLTQLRQRDDVCATILLTAAAKSSLLNHEPLSHSQRITLLEQPSCPAMLRLWREHWDLPRLIRSHGANVLLSTGNIAVRNSPVPQILLSRNALYTSQHFYSDLLARHEYGSWITETCKRFLAKRSVTWADCTITPSQAFAEELKSLTGGDILPLHHGFDCGTFFGCNTPLPKELADKLNAAAGCIRLLLVSHYNYYRNFETLFRALPLIAQELAPVPVRLFLTCRLDSNTNPGSYNADSAGQLVRKLGIRDQVVELGPVPYDMLHHVYKACHVYVTPAYAESFAHPLVEAMASALPIVASDLGVHRELCRDAATYFPTFSAEVLAEKVVRVGKSPTLRMQMADAGKVRIQDFSWSRHVQQIISIAEKLVSLRSAQMAPVSAARDASQLAS
jgi:glycosyltransferase involved in cell wall biosynthesis